MIVQRHLLSWTHQTPWRAPTPSQKTPTAPGETGRRREEKKRATRSRHTLASYAASTRQDQFVNMSHMPGSIVRTDFSVTPSLRPVAVNTSDYSCYVHTCYHPISITCITIPDVLNTVFTTLANTVYLLCQLAITLGSGYIPWWQRFHEPDGPGTTHKKLICIQFRQHKKQAAWSRWPTTPS